VLARRRGLLEHAAVEEFWLGGEVLWNAQLMKSAG
jgi:hypothetical protein